MYSVQERPKRIIATSNHIDQKYIRMLKGERSDTKELNINIKTLTLSHLHDLEAANQLSLTELELVKNYSLMAPSFASIIYLFFGTFNYLKLNTNNAMRKTNFELNAGKEQSGAFREARLNIRKYCQQFYRSNYFIKQFLKSSRMNFKNKLIIMKFLNKIERLPRRLLQKHEVHWKSSDLSLLQD